METLEKTKSKEMINMEKALAKIEQVEFEAEEVVNCDNENDLVSKKGPGSFLILHRQMGRMPKKRGYFL